MSNWFVGAFFVALGIAGVVGLFGVLAGVWEAAILLPGLLAAGWYSTRYRSGHVPQRSKLRR